MHWGKQHFQQMEKIFMESYENIVLSTVYYGNYQIYALFCFQMNLAYMDLGLILHNTFYILLTSGTLCF